ncbi:hypothetical protein [Roseivivax halotolerans]|uniref:hypothetical protein n=1 Tax=Roseivivax halotolerans TaxID=93684 RepID=UPI000B852B80|nr:hypothetical protein [Roseivivax halotolerans]
MVRFLLIAAVAISASLSGAMAASHAMVAEPEQGVTEMTTDTPAHRCDSSLEPKHSCHFLPALLPGEAAPEAASITSKDIFAADGRLLTGITPSGPLDPPRAI